MPCSSSLASMKASTGFLAHWASLTAGSDGRVTGLNAQWLREFETGDSKNWISLAEKISASERPAAGRDGPRSGWGTAAAEAPSARLPVPQKHQRPSAKSESAARPSRNQTAAR